jgi:hypothetical protein
MNVKLAIVFGAVVAASTSFAQASEHQDYSASAKSRQQVAAELKQFRAEHPNFNDDLEYPVLLQSAQDRAPQKSRQDVIAELKQFRAGHPNFNDDLEYPVTFQSVPTQPQLATMMSPSATR